MPRRQRHSSPVPRTSLTTSSTRSPPFLVLDLEDGNRGRRKRFEEFEISRETSRTDDGASLISVAGAGLDAMVDEMMQCGPGLETTLDEKNNLDIILSDNFGFVRDHSLLRQRNEGQDDDDDTGTNSEDCTVSDASTNPTAHTDDEHENEEDSNNTSGIEDAMDAMEYYTRNISGLRYLSNLGVGGGDHKEDFNIEKKAVSKYGMEYVLQKLHKLQQEEEETDEDYHTDDHHSGTQESLSSRDDDDDDDDDLSSKGAASWYFENSFSPSRHAAKESFDTDFSKVQSDRSSDKDPEENNSTVNLSFQATVADTDYSEHTDAAAVASQENPLARSYSFQKKERSGVFGRIIERTNSMLSNSSAASSVRSRRRSRSRSGTRLRSRSRSRNRLRNQESYQRYEDNSDTNKSNNASAINNSEDDIIIFDAKDCASFAPSIDAAIHSQETISRKESCEDEVEIVGDSSTAVVLNEETKLQPQPIARSSSKSMQGKTDTNANLSFYQDDHEVVYAPKPMTPTNIDQKSTNIINDDVDRMPARTRSFQKVRSRLFERKERMKRGQDEESMAVSATDILEDILHAENQDDNEVETKEGEPSSSRQSHIQKVRSSSRTRRRQAPKEINDDVPLDGIPSPDTNPGISYVDVEITCVETVSRPETKHAPSMDTDSVMENYDNKEVLYEPTRSTCGRFRPSYPRMNSSADITRSCLNLRMMETNPKVEKTPVSASKNNPRMNIDDGLSKSCLNLRMMEANPKVEKTSKKLVKATKIVTSRQHTGVEEKMQDDDVELVLKDKLNRGKWFFRSSNKKHEICGTPVEKSSTNKSRRSKLHLNPEMLFCGLKPKEGDNKHNHPLQDDDILKSSSDQNSKREEPSELQELSSEAPSRFIFSNDRIAANHSPVKPSPKNTSLETVTTAEIDEEESQCQIEVEDLSFLSDSRISTLFPRPHSIPRRSRRKRSKAQPHQHVRAPSLELESTQGQDDPTETTANLEVPRGADNKSKNTDSEYILKDIIDTEKGNLASKPGSVSKERSPKSDDQSNDDNELVDLLKRVSIFVEEVAEKNNYSSVERMPTSVSIEKNKQTDKENIGKDDVRVLTSSTTRKHSGRKVEKVHKYKPSPNTSKQKVVDAIFVPTHNDDAPVLGNVPSFGDITLSWDADTDHSRSKKKSVSVKGDSQACKQVHSSEDSVPSDCDLDNLPYRASKTTVSVAESSDNNIPATSVNNEVAFKTKVIERHPVVTPPGANLNDDDGVENDDDIDSVGSLPFLAINQNQTPSPIPFEPEMNANSPLATPREMKVDSPLAPSSYRYEYVFSDDERNLAIATHEKQKQKEKARLREKYLSSQRLERTATQEKKLAPQQQTRLREKYSSLDRVESDVLLDTIGYETHNEQSRMREKYSSFDRLDTSSAMGSFDHEERSSLQQQTRLREKYSSPDRVERSLRMEQRSRTPPLLNQAKQTASPFPTHSHGSNNASRSSSKTNFVVDGDGFLVDSPAAVLEDLENSFEMQEPPKRRSSYKERNDMDRILAPSEPYWKSLASTNTMVMREDIDSLSWHR